ncbi:MAG: sigma 54-interacting transcriptional regulator [Deltaproteobacteria bacterium]|nr:sigma 54-interacting transcriptional regulator [Deltaproteobacteria bacterium]
MKKQRSLEPELRDFFSIVQKAALANPFDADRSAFDRQLSGLTGNVPPEKQIEKAVYEVGQRVELLEKEGQADFRLYAGDDRQLVRTALLFQYFYRFREKFDRFILDQIDAGDTSLKVPFSQEALSFLRKRGFGIEESRRYFALSYQLRRAYFFINRRLVGRSPAMTRLRFNLWNNVFTHNIDLYERYLLNRMEDFSTLFLGETGTGKGIAAMALGCSGFIPFNEKKKSFQESFTRAFVSINLSQYPGTLIESELFGHKKGAFTGAVKDHIGVFGRCSPFGAILLDEIGEVKAPLQIKLLEVLQERIFFPVGSHEKSRFQGRVIAATNRPLKDLRSKKGLRDDFYYRLSSDIITVPPLRTRIQENPDELYDLLSFTIEKMIGTPSPEIVDMIKRVIAEDLGPEYAWPGNVRELEQCVRRIVLSRNYAGDDPEPASNDIAARLQKSIESGEIDAQNLLGGYCTMLYQRFGTFEEVARRTNLDRRTVKKYIGEWPHDSDSESA